MCLRSALLLLAYQLHARHSRGSASSRRYLFKLNCDEDGRGRS